MNDLLTVAPLTWSGIITAMLCAGAIGFERQLRGKPVGIRTSILIVLGTYAFTALAVSIGGNADRARVLGQVITGIGFLGAGVMLARDGVVVGVTSAATIWVQAAIGTLIGFGVPGTAITLAFLVVFVLLGVDVLENYSSLLTRGVHARYKRWRRRRALVNPADPGSG
ncbi:putative Mg2+ transporter-C (MgtC) family protein [Microbulbifer donghaiensis]|uniref:Protein MgtC n=1 Tax=Microbulbifer donghaiensis TaxID=494016 RepID=A0A1M5A6D2_9GAMM|nr:MgtC/SapB family protein [Microbulbifer donghaiensis]SHF25863.1 putative Mg2+ transporter-C (MgtC) family protein [Microbulbifer donghaiensis]